MRTYHPASWSEQAREKAMKSYLQWYEAMHSEFNYPGDEEYRNPEYWIKEIANSYRPAIIRYRAVKSFKRLIKKNRKMEYDYMQFHKRLKRIKRKAKKEV